MSLPNDQFNIYICFPPKNYLFLFFDNYSEDQLTSRDWWCACDDWPGPGRYHSQWLLRSKETEYDFRYV